MSNVADLRALLADTQAEIQRALLDEAKHGSDTVSVLNLESLTKRRDTLQLRLAEAQRQHEFDAPPTPPPGDPIKSN